MTEMSNDLKILAQHLRDAKPEGGAMTQFYFDLPLLAEIVEAAARAASEPEEPEASDLTEAELYDALMAQPPAPQTLATRENALKLVQELFVVWAKEPGGITPAGAVDRCMRILASLTPSPDPIREKAEALVDEIMPSLREACIVCGHTGSHASDCHLHALNLALGWRQ